MMVQQISERKNYITLPLIKLRFKLNGTSSNAISVIYIVLKNYKNSKKIKY